ncbi:hypothetical protein Mal64_25200 [Pseudobythopirellula maris]|uniref:Uncharacterized protein n=1 Tax=Pseudobythopirellula maris TaxID=2527991 RepID=A0A5C5ZNK3_9BACT|nr:hypothetical protein [Pseudobythopirellula maris]TWT89029.1 hypothetical protein Mal64_25200 [Pseudobythopirellula maris]
MDFSERLKKAASRGAAARAEQAFADAAEAMGEEELRRLHSSRRLELTEHIEKCLKQLADNFPGFRFETIVEEGGWGAAVVRDDLAMAGGKRNNLFSRLQLTVSPYNEYHVVDATAKGAVRNKESFSRTHYQKIKEYDGAAFRELLEKWVLDYAEMYAAG